MARKMYEEANIAAIAQKIRDKAETETTYTTAEMPNGVDEVYEKGYEKGKSEGGSNKLPQVIDKTVTKITVADLEGATKIGNHAFMRCSNLIGVELPSNITSIGDDAFAYTAISHITIPDSVTSIGAFAFYNSYLETMTLGKGITSIGRSAFDICNLFKTVYYNGDIESWCNIDFEEKESTPSYKTKDKTYFLNSLGEYEVLENVVVPSTITAIKNFTFAYWTALKSITLPNTITSIGERAFERCSNITEIRIGNEITSIGSNAFLNCSKLTNIYIDAPEGSISGSPWGASYAQIHWNTPLPSAEE